MSKEHIPKTKILSHTAAAIGGGAIVYAVHRGKLKQAHQTNQEARFNALKLQANLKEAGLDYLTGLPGREILAETYQGLISGAKRRRSGEQKPDPKAYKHSVFLLDIDNFKSINDALGHNEGDEVKKLVSSKLTERLRGRDVVALWGGDEFAAIVPRSTEEDAIAIAEELRSSIQDTGKATVSVGVTSVDLSEARPLSLEDIISQADLAVYAAKEAGRNQVVAYSSLQANS